LTTGAGHAQIFPEPGGEVQASASRPRIAGVRKGSLLSRAGNSGMQVTARTNPMTPEVAGVSDILCGLIAGAILFIIFVTLDPFTDLGRIDPLETSSGGEAPTYFIMFFLAAAAGLLLYRIGRLTLPCLATRANLALLAWLLTVGVAMSIDPGVSARRFVLCFLTFLLAAMLPALTRGSKQFAALLVVTAATVLVLSYLGVLLMPHLTIHQLSDLGEPELAGAWRGIYGHKNTAAGVMAVFVYVGWFAARMGKPLAGGLIALASFVFLVFSGGKSALGMVFIVTIVAFLVDRARSIWTKALVVLGPLAILSFLTIGSVVSTAARAVLGALSIDPTFSGRTDIWKFAFEVISEHPWKGHGFEAFWYLEALRYGVEDKTRWAATVASSHNSYLDIALTIGIPGLALVFIAFVIAPLRDFHRVLPTAENIALGRFFMVLWLFALYLGTFEAFFLSRVNPMWFVLALSVCGLRYTALLAVKE
jgi:O-antigen ligase